MRNDRHASIQNAINARLSGMESGQDFERTVLRRVRGDVKVKKKLSAAFAITAVLVLTATAVLAASLFTDYFSGYNDLKNSYTAVNSIPETAPTAEPTAEPTEQPDETPAQLHDYDANPGQILINARGELTEILGLSSEDADQYTTSAEFIWSDTYCGGTEPVWIVTLSLDYAPIYKVLLGYDGKHIDCVLAWQEFTTTQRSDEQLGFTGGSEQFNAQGDYFYDWSLEEKAAFSSKWIPAAALYMERNPYFTGEGNAVWAWTRREYGLPGEGSITQEQALSLAQEAARQSITDADPALSPDSVYYFYDVTDEQQPLWLVILTWQTASETEAEEAKARCFVTIDAVTGTVLDAYEDHSETGIDDFLSAPWQASAAEITATEDEQLSDMGLTDKVPAEQHDDDATEEEAIAAARAALTDEIGVSQSDADQYTATAEFFYSVWYNWGKEPVWLVTFSLEDVSRYKVLLGYDASYIDWALPDQEFSQLFRSGDELGDYTELNNAEGVPIFDWTLEEKAAFSEKWAPLAEAYKAEHPYFTGSQNNFWQWTRRTFGLPSDTDIQQDEALQIAKESLKQYGETDETLSQIEGVQYFFDVTDPDQPQWRMCIYWLADFENDNVENERHYLIKIDAVTGEVMETIVCPQGFDVNEILSAFISEP